MALESAWFQTLSLEREKKLVFTKFALRFRIHACTAYAEVAALRAALADTTHRARSEAEVETERAVAQALSVGLCRLNQVDP
jgi:hypothetical protein